MKCDSCVWLKKINELKASCLFTRCVKDNGWKVDEKQNRDDEVVK